MDSNQVEKLIGKYKNQGFFVFIPSPVLSEKESFYMPVIDEVFLTEDDIYPSGTGDYQFWRIKFTGLSKLALSANIEWSLDGTGRTDNRNDKLYCSYEATGGVRNADGSLSFYKAEKDLDLEITEMELTDTYSAKSKDQNYINKCVRRDMIQKRKNKLMLVESGAKSRVIRFLLGLTGQTKNKKNLIGNPFIIVSYVINYSREDVKGVILGSLPNAMNKIYGSRQPERIDYSTPDAIDIEPDEPEKKEDTPEKKFENYTIPEQVKILKDGCKAKCLDWKMASCNTDMEKANQNHRSDFYNWIKKEKSRC